MGGCLSLRQSRKPHYLTEKFDLSSSLPIDELTAVVIREAQFAARSDDWNRPRHIQTAKEALHSIRYRDPHHADLAHLSAVVDSLDLVLGRDGSYASRDGRFDRGHFNRDVFAAREVDLEAIDRIPRHLHERLGLSHLPLRDEPTHPHSKSNSDSGSGSGGSSPSGGSSANSTRSIMSRAIRHISSEYEAFDHDSAHLLSVHDHDDSTTRGTSDIESPTHASNHGENERPKSPQWLVEQCQILRRKLDHEKKERLKAEEKLMRAEDAATKLHSALKKVTLGEDLSRVVVAPKPKVRASASRGSTHARQFKPITPPSGRCAASNYDENSSRGKAQSSTAPVEDKHFAVPSIYYPGVTPREDFDGSNSVLSSNSYFFKPCERLRGPSLGSARAHSHISDAAPVAHAKAHSMVSLGTVGNPTVHSYSPIASPAQAGIVDLRDLAVYKDRRTTDLTVRVMNGVSEEEIVKFYLPKTCFSAPHTFLSQLDRLCQLHAGHPLSRVNWLRFSPGGTERRHCNMRMLQDLMLQPLAMPLYLSTVPMPSPAELLVCQPAIRLKSLVPAKITFTGLTMSVPRVFLETTELSRHEAYSITFTDQWTRTTYIVEGFVAENKCGVYFSVPNALLKKEAGGGSGLYDVHLLVNGTHRSENRRALAVTSSDRALSSKSSNTSFDTVR